MHMIIIIIKPEQLTCYWHASGHSYNSVGADRVCVYYTAHIDSKVCPCTQKEVGICVRTRLCYHATHISYIYMAIIIYNIHTRNVIYI